MEVFKEDIMARPRHAHVFVVPRLMTYLWRKQLGNDADVFMTITVRDHFWEKHQHKPLILAIVLPFAYVENYSRPWIARGLEKSETFWKEFKAGFKITGSRNPIQFPHMDGKLCIMWGDPEGRSRTMLLQFLDWERGFPPVQRCLVQKVLQGVFMRPVPKVARSRTGIRQSRK